MLFFSKIHYFSESIDISMYFLLAVFLNPPLFSIKFPRSLSMITQELHKALLENKRE